MPQSALELTIKEPFEPVLFWGLEDFTTAAMRLILEPFTLITEFTSLSWPEDVRYFALAVFHVSGEVPCIFYPLEHVVLAKSMPLSIVPAALIIYVFSERKAA